jgi:hypothetical protein
MQVSTPLIHIGATKTTLIEFMAAAYLPLYEGGTFVPFFKNFDCITVARQEPTICYATVSRLSKEALDARGGFN